MDIRQFIVVHGALDAPPCATLVDKYKPRRSTDVLVNDITYLCIKQWIAKYKARDPTIKKMLLVSGPSGLGKSILARLLLGEAGYTVHDLSVKSRAELAPFLEMVASNPRNAILIDDLDSLLDQGQGIASDVLMYVNPIKGKRTTTKEDKDAYRVSYWKVPIIALCTRHDYGRSGDFSKECDVVQMRRPARSVVESFLAKIARAEGIKLSPETQREIATASGGDIRQALLQMETRLVFKKDRDIDALSALDTLLKSNRPLDCSTALRLAHADTSIVPLMVYENYLDLCQMHGTDGLDKAMRSIEDISVSDAIENAMYSRGRFDMFDVHAVFSVVSPCLLSRTLSTHEVRFGSLWNKQSTAQNKRVQMRAIRDSVPGLECISDDVGRYEYIVALRRRLEMHIKDVDKLRNVCPDPSLFQSIARFGLAPPIISPSRLQTLAKKL